MSDTLYMRSIFPAADLSLKAKTIVDNISNPTASESKTNPIEMIFGTGLFLLPFFFLPFTADVVNLNKTYLVLFVATISLALFFFQAWKKGSLYVKDFRTYLPLILLLVAGLLSAYFSQSRRISFFGQYGTYSTSFITIAALVAIAFVASNVRLRVAKLYKFLIWGVTLATFFSWLGLYRVFVPGIGNLFPGFSFVESFSAMLGLQVVVGLITLYLLLKGELGKSTASGLAYGFAVVLNLALPLTVMNVYAIVLLVLGIVFLAFFSDENSFSRNKYLIGAIALVTVLIVGFHQVPNFREVLGFESRPNAARLDLTSSWYISASALTQNPVWGSGLGTFINDFTRFRPAYLNQTQFWNLRFFTPFNDVFLWIATAGLVGAGAYLAFMYLITANAWKARNEVSANLVSYGLIMAVLALLLTGTSLSMYVLLFILAGVLFQNSRSTVLSVKSKGVVLSMFVVSVVIVAALSWHAFNVYSAQYWFRQSLQKGSLLERYQLQRKALAYDKYESFYYREALTTNMVTAARMSNAENLTDDQKADIQRLVIQAAADAKIITEIIDPRSSANWEYRGLVYRTLIGSEKETNNFSTLALQSYLNALVNDPTNPKLRVDIGGIYYLNKDYQNAVNNFARSIQLKNDYSNAYYNLAYALKDAGAYEQAVMQLEVVKRLLPENSPNMEKVDKDLSEFRALLEDAKQKAQQQAPVNVPEVSAATESTDQSPANQRLVTADEEEKVNPESEVDVSLVEKDQVPSANGAEVDESQGQTDAPLSKPAE